MQRAPQAPRETVGETNVATMSQAPAAAASDDMARLERVRQAKQRPFVRTVDTSLVEFHDRLAPFGTGSRLAWELVQRYIAEPASIAATNHSASELPTASPASAGPGQ